MTQSRKRNFWPVEIDTIFARHKHHPFCDGGRSSPDGYAREAITLGENAISVVSYWEVTIKTMKGNLDVEDPAKWWDQALCELSAPALTIRPEHIKQVFDLPPIHKDPFDRMLIAQAIAEGLTLITTDARLASYASKSFKVIC